jgi:hypothetical protein
VNAKRLGNGVLFREGIDDAQLAAPAAADDVDLPSCRLLGYACDCSNAGQETAHEESELSVISLGFPPLSRRRSSTGIQREPRRAQCFRHLPKPLIESAGATPHRPG